LRQALRKPAFSQPNLPP